MISEGKSYYSIGKVSTLCCVPIKTLRYYDKIGLLVPEYRKDDMEELRLIPLEYLYSLNSGILANA